MPLLTPDPTFYPSPRMAMQARQEKLGYVVLINPTGKDKPDAMGVIDLDPESLSGFAFGLGLDRMANVRHGITDIRDLFANDLRLLRQL